MKIKENNLKLFCSAKRPKHCFYDNNMCCVFCDRRKECLEINKKEKSNILPCGYSISEIILEECDFSL